PGTYDAHNALINLMATPGPGGPGLFNLGSYSNKEVDELTFKVGAEADKAKRQQLISAAFKLHKDDFGHIPLHQQALAWGMRKNVAVVQLPDNFNFYKWIKVD
ncbi:MAG: ABC transporter substrate-binding protein, partial [Burkholderiaceae bacterium]